MNELSVVEITDKGCFLNAEHENVFIPLSQMRKDLEVGDTVSVFLYMDDGRLTATAHRPKAMVGDVAYLPIIGSNRFGYFLDNSIRKDLFLPFDETRIVLKEGDNVFVFVYLDAQQRLCCTTRYQKHISDIIKGEYNKGDKVKVLPIDKTKLGFKVIVENCFYAIIHNDDVFNDDIKIGKKLYAYIKNIRKDKKVDISLKADFDKTVNINNYHPDEGLTSHILRLLEENKGFIPFNDKSSPDLINKVFKVSKGDFKKAIGFLFKQKIIVVDDEGLKLQKKE